MLKGAPEIVLTKCTHFYKARAPPFGRVFRASMASCCAQLQGARGGAVVNTCLLLACGGVRGWRCVGYCDRVEAV